MEPLFNTNSNWNSVKFGSNPRQLIYSDSTQMLSFDSRVPNVNGSSTSVFSLPNNYLSDANEFIYRTNTHSNQHFICCSKSILIVDERCPNRPLLLWKNPHRHRVLALDVANLLNDTQAVISCDKNEVFSHQFSLKTKMPVSFNYPEKLYAPGKTNEQSDTDECVSFASNVGYSLINGVDYLGVFEVKFSF